MNSNLQNKLQQFSASPPDGAWNKIADALDTQGTFSQRLYDFEEQPPAGSWQQIEHRLSQEPAKLIPLTTRLRKPLRYAAVAGLLAVILVTITLTVKRTEAGAIEPGSSTTVPTKNKSVIKPAAESNNPVTIASPEQDGRPETLTTPADKAGTTTKNKDIPAATIVAAGLAPLNDYVFFRDGDGKLRKVSKKMASFVNCKDGDTDCQQRLKRLRQKMATEATTTDFAGVLDLLRQLQ